MSHLKFDGLRKLLGIDADSLQFVVRILTLFLAVGLVSAVVIGIMLAMSFVV